MANTNVLLCLFDVLHQQIEFAVCDVTDCGVLGSGEGLIFACLFCFWFGGILHCIPSSHFPLSPNCISCSFLSHTLTKPRHFATRNHDSTADHGLRLATCLTGLFVSILILTFFFIRRRQLVRQHQRASTSTQRHASTNTLGLIMFFPLPPNLLPAPELYVFPCLQDDKKNWLDKNGNFKTEELDLYICCFFLLVLL